MNELSSDILRLSNLDGKGPRKVGETGAVGPWGTVDMAGNVKEWCANELQGKAELRYILGGAWDEPGYRYTEADAQNPWDRAKTYGVRLAKNVDAGAAAAPIAHVYGDPKSVVPVSETDYHAYRRFYDYDRTPLNARVDSVDDSSPYWRKESVSFDAAYGGERVPALLFLPRNVRPPYQTVVLFPSGYALLARSNHHLDYSRFEFIIRSGLPVAARTPAPRDGAVGYAAGAQAPRRLRRGAHPQRSQRHGARDPRVVRQIPGAHPLGLPIRHSAIREW